MAFVKPDFSREKVSKAGRILVSKTATQEERCAALEILNRWRACHAYPINTFQATLRKKLKRLKTEALVAQRLKRTPSIIRKLELNPGMQMARMQDVGGLRAVVSNIGEAYKLRKAYTEASFTHQLSGEYDYIETPKKSGYRSIHLIYKYKNPSNPIYDGLSLELQIRTKLQHAWATAVETIGTYLGQALKSSEGSEAWLNYFKLASAVFAHMEECPAHEDFKHLSFKDLCNQLKEKNDELNIIEKLNSFSIATNAIEKRKVPGNYHVIFLDSINKKVSIRSYGQQRIDAANMYYALLESMTKEQDGQQVVLVATNSIKALRKAYPNYFLDTKAFIAALRKVERIC